MLDSKPGFSPLESNFPSHRIFHCSVFSPNVPSSQRPTPTNVSFPQKILLLSTLPPLLLSQNLLQCGIILVLICSLVDYLTSLGKKMTLQGKLSLIISVYLPDINDIYNLYYELHAVISVCVCVCVCVCISHSVMPDSL